MSDKVNDYVTSIVRTIVPLVLTYVATLVVAKTGWVISQEKLDKLSSDIVLAIVPVVLSVLYPLLRKLEERFPIVSILFGSGRKPNYQ